jgi:hypothetical protein
MPQSDARGEAAGKQNAGANLIRLIQAKLVRLVDLAVREV